MPEVAIRRPRARKSLGQHFLISKRVLRRIIAAADLDSADTVIEIGPGRGILTAELAASARRVVAVEVDERLVGDLRERFRDAANVELVQADAREIDTRTLIPPGAPYKVVANLPYYAASPIVRRFLGADHKPYLMVVMLQREVARNMTAAPGDMTVLSVAVQLYGKPKIISSVPARAFRPAPKVTSAVLRIDVYAQPAVEVDSPERFIQLVKAGFSARRKQLRNSLQQGLSLARGRSEELLAEAGVDPQRRPQTLSLAEWARLYQASRRP